MVSTERKVWNTKLLHPPENEHLQLQNEEHIVSLHEPEEKKIVGHRPNVSCVLQNIESVQCGDSEIKMEILSLANEMRKIVLLGGDKQTRDVAKTTKSK